jgi:hypothetical protein
MYILYTLLAAGSAQHLQYVVCIYAAIYLQITFLFAFYHAVLFSAASCVMKTKSLQIDKGKQEILLQKLRLQFSGTEVFILLRCSDTTLTGESRSHISPPWGFKPGSLVTGSKQVVHWTSETWWEWSEIAGSPQGSPPAADSVSCEAGRETCSERENRTGKLCWDQVGLSHYRHEGLVMVRTKPASDEVMMINHVGVTNVARQR